MRMTRAIPLLITPAMAAIMLLSACGSREGFPSLAKRPVERITGSAPVVSSSPVTPPATIPTDLGLQSRLARLTEQARDAHAHFVATKGKTAGLVAAAAGAGVASESWSQATVALASLESRRSDAMIALAELDMLYAKERIDGGDGGAIAAARDQITAWVADEDAVLAELRGRVAG